MFIYNIVYISQDISKSIDNIYIIITTLLDTLYLYFTLSMIMAMDAMEIKYVDTHKDKREQETLSRDDAQLLTKSKAELENVLVDE